ncbi:MAG: hypothetical protein H7257_12555 [Taibaiella sp.]|nr:hypothetical protein [Taibaiella sp.]
MKNLLIILLASLLSGGCKCVTNTAKKAINKTGEVVGEGSSEFVKGVAKGVENTLECSVTVSDELKLKGVSFGRFFISKDSGSKDNKLTVYLIFGKEFAGNISAKVFDAKGTEYGRAVVNIAAHSNEAKYTDFIFDQRTDVESKSRFVLE